MDAPVFDWRECPAQVEGRVMRLGQIDGGCLYHGSFHRLRVGDILQPGVSKKNFRDSRACVSLTSNVGRAMYWAREAQKKRKVTGPVYVYTVDPLDPVELWRCGPGSKAGTFIAWEACCDQARIVAVAEQVIENGMFVARPISG